MAKVRVYELAKQQGISSKELLEILKDLGVDASSHTSGIEESTAKLVSEVIESQRTSKAKAPIAKLEEDKIEKSKEKPAKKATEKIAVQEEKKEPSRVKHVIVDEVLSRAPVEAPPEIEKIPLKAEKIEAPREPEKVEVPEKPERVEGKIISFTLPMTVSELADKLSVKANDIIRKMLQNGVAVTINQALDNETASQIVETFGFTPELMKPKLEELLEEEEDDPRFHVLRPPVVTILGHVDHGKTSLLDAIRKTNVTAKEAGGITQKIGASTVEHNSRKIVFVDTPGHEAFTAMRARGAQVTDIAVLVVAADDGVMPQTIEAIDHARAAKVPIIVAINKVDKPQANPDRVKQQLSDLGLLPEDWGGDVICIPVSAKEKTGLEDLLEMILLVADMNEFKANPRLRASGIIIESNMDKGLGPIATVIVKKGTLRLGDYVVAGTSYGRVRVLINDKGERIKKATPSIPAEIVGLSEVPNAGDMLYVVTGDKIARQISGDRQTRDREMKLVPGPKMTLEDISRQLKEGEKKELNLIVKSDNRGSTEALKHALTRISDEEVTVNVIHGGVGPVTESDILLASASAAIIISFNVRLDPYIKKLADSEKVDIRQYKVIYNVIDDVKAAMKGLLEPVYEEVFMGRADVRQVFKVSKIGVIAGAYVTGGKLIRGADAKVVRGSETIFQGKIDSLKRFKDDVKEVAEGFECGIGIEKFSGIQPNDVIEAYQMQEKAR